MRKGRLEGRGGGGTEGRMEENVLGTAEAC